MSDATFATSDECFATIVERLRCEPNVATPPPAGKSNRFGSSALKVDGKIFAMLVRGELGVKLPVERVNALVAAGVARPFEPRPGRRMKEWVTIAGMHDAWLDLANEAMLFVARISEKSRPRRTTTG